MKMWMTAGMVASLSVAALGQDYNGGALCPLLGAGPDVTLCEVYDFGSTQRVDGGSWSGVASNIRVGTTSWNVGTAELLWEQSPDPDHPMISMSIYRLLDGRFENIANHWIKHGFFALSSSQCIDATLGACQGVPNGTRLGLACTDTYSPGLNDGPILGPRYEINPWTGVWAFSNSIFETGGGPTYAGSKQLQVHDDDINMLANPGARYFVEASYITTDDICIYNSASYKEVFITGTQPDGRPIFTPESARTTPPHQIYTILDAWTGATLTEIAEDLALIKGVSPDGRAIVGAHVTDLGNGTWKYDYAVMNIDMDRQMDQFWVDLPQGVTVTNLYFHAPTSHEEEFTYEFGGGTQGPPRNNVPWTSAVLVDKVRWSTAAHQAGVPSNPIGWGTAYTFGFTANTAPATGTMAVTAYKAGAAGPIVGATQAPSAGVVCQGDTNGDNLVNLSDLNNVLFNFGGPGPTGDVNASGGVDLADLNIVLFNFGNTC